MKKGLDPEVIAFFCLIGLLAVGGSIFIWNSSSLGTREAWALLLSGFAAWIVFIHWQWRFPYSFGRYPRQLRPTSFTQPFPLWRFVITAMVAGYTVPFLAYFKPVEFRQILGSLLLGLVLYLMFFIRIWYTQNQRERDLRAARTLRDLKSGSPHPFSLYLRPFDSTGQMLTIRPPLDFTRTREFIDTETVVAEAMEPTSPLIALGAPMEAQGAGRVAVTEESWRDNIQMLISHAELIFVLPPERESGTRWEVEWILANKHLGKCIFLMPPDWSDNWRHAAKEMKTLGLPPLDYRHEGLLFTITDSKAQRNLAGAASLAGLQDDPRELRKEIDSLRQRTALISLPPVNSPAPDKDYEPSELRTWFWASLVPNSIKTGMFALIAYMWLS